MLNQHRSTPVRCFTRPAGVGVDAGTGVPDACSSVRPLTLCTTVARRKSRKPVSVSRSSPSSIGRVLSMAGSVAQPTDNRSPDGACPAVPVAAEQAGQVFAQLFRVDHLRGGLQLPLRPPP